MSTTPNITDDQSGSSALGRFVNAWSLELSGMLWQLVRPSRRRLMVLNKTSDKIEVHSKKNQKLGVVNIDGGLSSALINVRSILQKAGASRQKSVMKLDRDQVLTKQLMFPQEAQDVLEPIVRNQLQHLVPWPVAETHFGFQITDHVGDKIAVSVAAMHRDQLDSLKRSAAEAQINLSRIETSELGENSASVVLFDEAVRKQEALALLIRRTLAVLATAAVLLGATGVHQWYSSAQTSHALTNEIGRLRVELTSRSTERDAREDLASQIAGLLGAKTKSAMSLTLLDELTRAIPDQAFLNSATFKDGLLTIAGKADDAAALIAALERSGRFQSVQFSGPTMRKSQSGKENFAIEAKVVVPASAQSLWRKPNE